MSDYLRQHEAGWSVVLDGEEIAVLEFLRINPPFYLFTPRLRTTEEEKVSYALRKTTRRDPGERLVFRGRGFDAVVPDAGFFVNLGEDGIVSIRDMRAAMTFREKSETEPIHEGCVTR